MDRRHLIAGALALPASACSRPLQRTAARTPPLDLEELNRAFTALAARAAPGVLGVGLMDLDSGETFIVNGDRRFPMQSVFKAPLGAAVLAEVDARRLALNETIEIRDIDLSPPRSPVADAWPGVRSYTVAELLRWAVGQSDNTAADVLMKRIGGPGAVTAWLQAKRVPDLRIDRYERQLQTEALGMASFRPAWRGEPAFRAALLSVPEAQRRAAMTRYLADPRDTATPRGMLMFLSRLAGGELLSPAATQLLLREMILTPTGAQRLKAGLPEGSILAHKTGTGRTDLGINPATNDVGVVTLPDKRRYAIAVFLSGVLLEETAREALIAEAARAIVRGVR